MKFIYYKCHKVSFKHGGLYIDSSDWRKKKKATKNSKNTFDKRSQYVVTVALNNQENKWNQEIV